MRAYITYLARVFRFDFSVYQPQSLPASPFIYTFLNVFLAGLIYGLFSLQFNLGQLEAFPDAYSRNFTAVLIVLSGISVVIMAQAASSLFIWTFCRGVGGNTGLINYYVGTGMVMPVFWLALPFYAAMGAGLTGTLVSTLAAITTAAAVVSLVASVKEASGLAAGRLTIAIALVVIFVGSFLYLWVL